MDAWTVVVPGILWLVTTVLTLASFSRVRGTTLTGSWTWICVSCALLALAHFKAGGMPGAQSSHLLPYVAVTAALCPNIAILGAKRPQSQAWPFVVISLWVVLLSPAIEASMAGRIVPDTHGLRAAFLWLLALSGLVNYVATRFAVPAALAMLAQSLLIGMLLGVIPHGRQCVCLPLAGFCGLAAVIIARFPISRFPAGLAPMDRVWLRFRDAYGAVWALRIAQRVNETARHRAWSGRIEWSGVQGNGEVQDCLTTLLRSFVSRTWLEAEFPPEDLSDDRSSV